MAPLLQMTSSGLAQSLSVGARSFAWFVGAGASAAGGVPTAYDMILDFKTRLFCSATRIPRREIDPTDPLWNQRITAYFNNSHGFPANGDPEEYAAAFEAVYPDVEDRHQYIDTCVRRGASTFGHRLVAAMIASGQIPCVLTTNFDPLIERSATVAAELLPVDQRAHLAVSTLDSVEIARRCVHQSDWPLLVKLHGDYQSTRLKNTAAELQTQEESLRSVFVDLANRFGLVVVGYSGRDASVMDTLEEALEGPSPFPAGIRWVIRSGHKPLRAVLEFLGNARRVGVDACLVEAETFDELAADINNQVALPPQLATHVLEARPQPLLQPVVLSQRIERDTFPVLRCSALPVTDLPNKARRLKLGLPVTTEEARKAIKSGRFRAVVTVRGHEAYCFGADKEILNALESWGARIDGVQPLNPQAVSWALGLIYDALIRSLTRARPLRPILRARGHAVVVGRPNPKLPAEMQKRDRRMLNTLKQAYGKQLFGSIPSLDLPFAEGIRIRLEGHDQRWWCVFEPFTWIDVPRQDTGPPQGRHRSPGSRGWSNYRSLRNSIEDWRRERWAQQYNPRWSRIIDAWSQMLVSGDQGRMNTIGLRNRPGVDAAFAISSVTAWCRPSGGGDF